MELLESRTLLAAASSAGVAESGQVDTAPSPVVGNSTDGLTFVASSGPNDPQLRVEFDVGLPDLQLSNHPHVLIDGRLTSFPSEKIQSHGSTEVNSTVLPNKRIEQKSSTLERTLSLDTGPLALDKVHELRTVHEDLFALPQSGLATGPKTITYAVESHRYGFLAGPPSTATYFEYETQFVFYRENDSGLRETWAYRISRDTANGELTLIEGVHQSQSVRDRDAPPPRILSRVRIDFEHEQATLDQEDEDETRVWLLDEAGHSDGEDYERATELLAAIKAAATQSESHD